MHLKFYGEVLPYLEVQKSNLEEDDSIEQVEMPNVTGLSVEEAKKILKEVGLELEISGEETNSG